MKITLKKAKVKTPRLEISGREDKIEALIEQAISRFFANKRKQVPDFVRSHFRYPGCWHTNKHGLGLDLLRAPINLLWAPLYISLVLLLLLIAMCGFKSAKRWLGAIPTGLTTQVQRHVNERIRAELLSREELKQEVLAELSAALETNDGTTGHSDKLVHLETIVDEALSQLILTRTASADIANTLFSTAFGAMIFKKFTPGGFGIGLLIAAYYATESAKQSFVFGPTLGGIYYSLFPPQASWIENTAGVALAMLILATVASFSGLITDPVQSWLGLHRMRLNKMLRKLEMDLIKKTSSSFKPLDPYIARILELFDTFKAQINL